MGSLNPMSRYVPLPGRTQRFLATMCLKRGDHLIEHRLQMRGMDRIEHRADVIVGRDPLHPEQRLAIRRLAPLLQRALIGQE